MKKIKIAENANQKAISEYLLVMHQSGRGIWWRTNNVGIWDPVKKVYRKPKGALQLNGVSDIAGVYRGIAIFIEVKSSTGTLSEDQELFRDLVEGSGGVFIMARNIEDIEWIFQHGKLEAYLNGKKTG